MRHKPVSRRSALGGLVGIVSTIPESAGASDILPVNTPMRQGSLSLLSVRVATNEAISRFGLQSLGEISLEPGDRVLDKDDPVAARRGIYVVTPRRWRRATDFASGTDLSNGAFVTVAEGAEAGAFVLPAQSTARVGSTPQDWRVAHSNAASKIVTTGGESVQAGLDGLRSSQGASLIGFRMPITDALERMSQGKLAERVSWLDFIPPQKHTGILEHSNRDDLTVYLQRMLDDVPSGSRLYIPGRVNFEGSLVRNQSLMLYGDPGRETFDNSWDRSTGGSQLIHRGQSGDGLTFRPPSIANNRINVVLRDFILRGNRLTDDNRPTGAQGRGLVIDGWTEHTTFVRADIDNVHVAQAADEGIDLVGSVYGGSVRNIFVHRCGKTGFRAVSSSVGIGEMWLARLRLFSNGWEGRNEAEMAGLFWQAGTMLASHVSCSENRGPGAILAGGPISIDTLQLESNGFGVKQADQRRQVIFGRPGAGIRAGRVTNIMSDPGERYAGAHILVTEQAGNITLAGLLSSDLGPSGRHIERERGSRQIDYSGLQTSSSQFRIVDRASDFATVHHAMMVARLDQGLLKVTGDGTQMAWAPDSVVWDPQGIYDRSTGTIIAPASGAYRIEVSIGLDSLSKDHGEAQVMYNTTNLSRIEEMGNPGMMRTSAGRLTLKAAPLMLLQQGDRCQVMFRVAGGAKSVGTIGGGKHGFLTVSTAH